MILPESDVYIKDLVVKYTPLVKTSGDLISFAMNNSRIVEEIHLTNQPTILCFHYVQFFNPISKQKNNKKIIFMCNYCSKVKESESHLDCITTRL